jgi:hypothetical protein
MASYKLTLSKKKEILKLAGIGLTVHKIASLSGVPDSTLRDWLKWGKRGKNKKLEDFYREFTLAGSLVSKKATMNVVSKIQQGDMVESKWWLEKMDGIGKPEKHQHEESEIELTTNTLDLLREQAKDLKRSMSKAEGSESWQAYAALQRQFLSVIQQIRQIESEEGIGDELDGITDDQLINEITGAIVSLPPILRQKVEGIIFDMKNVIPIGREK